MTDKELRHLSRMELIQILLEQTRETERLKKELDDAKEQLNDRRILISRAGSIAEATVSINQLMETAQATADQYVESVKQEYTAKLKKEYAARQRKMELLEEATKQRCMQMLKEAKREAEEYGRGA